MKPLYLCAGMPRSGSTWLYNVVRLLCERHYDKVHSCYVYHYQRDWLGWADAAVIKVHEPVPILFHPDARVKQVVLTCRRDLRDVAASHILKGWQTEANVVGILHTIVAWYKFYEAKSAFEFEYESLLIDPVSLIKDIGVNLGKPSNWQGGFGMLDTEEAREVAVEVSQLSNTSSATYDKTNLLHRNHSTRRVVGYYKEVLSPALIKNIEATFGDWLRKWGYM